MGVFADMAERFDKAASLVPAIVDLSIEATEKQLLDLNRSQLIIGQKSDGQAITPKYSTNYAKRKKGSRSSPTPDLKVTGKFYRSFQTKLTEKQIEIEGTRESKGFDVAEHLEKRYSEDIYGLTENHIGIYGNVLLPIFTKKLEDVL